MRATEWPDRVLDNWVGLLVDTVSVLISLSAATAIRFGTLGVTQYLGPLWPAVVLLVGVRLGFLQALGLHNAPATVFRRRQVVSLVAAVALSSLFTALLILGLTAPFGRTGWFRFTILLLELPLGVICAVAVRLSWGMWEQSIVPRWARELEVLRSRAGTILSAMFIALAVVVLWQALGLVAALLPVTLESLLAGVRVSILSALLFLLPGYAVLALARPRMGLGPLEGLIVSAGLSVAVVPLLLYFCSLAGIELNSFSVGAIFILLGALALWRSLPQMRRAVGNPRLRSTRRGWRVRLGQVRSLWKGGITEGQAFYTALALVFLMAFVVRFYVVRDLIVPPGGDSVHHTMITQLLVDNGGLFSSWEPYAPLITFTYHFGFHALAAFYHWLTGVTVIKSVIMAGQIINFLSVPLVYVLTQRLTKSRWAGLVAALIPGFLCLMPMYYVNWGRYTQLAGQTILAVAMVFTAGNVGARRKDLGAMAITVLALAGLVLTHYFVAAFFVCFLMALLVAKTCVGWGNRQPVARMWLTTLIVVAGALALVLPWLVNLMTGPLVQRMLGSWNAEMPRAEISWGQQYNGVLAFSATGDVFFFLPWYLFALSALGAGLAFKERRTEIITIVFWTSLLFVLANPHVVHLPGTGLVNNTTIMIALYIPASLVVGWFVGRLIDSARTRAQGIPHMVGIAALACVLASQGSMVGLLRPESVFVTQSDMEAMGWIKDHTGADAKFLVSTVLWEGPQTVVGTDAGWWLPLLARREGTVPPMIYKDEDCSERNYAAKTNAFAAAVRDADFGAAETLRLLRQNGITHVYIGDADTALQPMSFVVNPCYELLYHKDEVWVFEVLYDCVHASGELPAAGNACRAKYTLPNSHQPETP